MIPQTLRFEEVKGLSNELVEKFEEARPETLGAAARISGTTPASLTAILSHVRRVSGKKRRNSNR